MPKCASCGSEIAEGSSCPACEGTVVIASTPRIAFEPSGDGRFVPGAVVAERYRIIALLGQGGMGEVYRADDLTLGQAVALKFLPVAMTRDEDALRRFRNEVRLARKVSHPNVCRVYDVGEVDGHLFLSMEYVDGEDLGSLLRRIGRLPSDKALEIARKLCAGLAAAHEKGVLHRDLKPGNIMLDGRGQVLLTDFGLAGLSGEIAAADVRSGTPAYMAPEQLAGREVTIQSDIYSLGLVVYELFTGKRPFQGDTLADLLRAQNEATPTSLTTLVRDLDPTVERVILRCLDPEPSRRPPSALAVSAALPGGDPLAAALAAGETPSPQMVAAAGEGAGLELRVAIPVFAAILIGLVVCCALGLRKSALEMIRPEYPPEVLSQKAEDLAQRLGYVARPYDRAGGFSWDGDYISAAKKEKPFPGWGQIVTRRPSLLNYWFRLSPYPLTGTDFHDEQLTPGIVTADSPPPTLSGMIQVDLDAQGRLLRFQAVPEQVEKDLKPAQPPDWSPLFAAAALDPAQFTPAEPVWTWLASTDTRTAWTGTWPGTNRPLRVEAAALRGRPVAFALIGTWTKPDRMPPPESADRQLPTMLVMLVLALAVYGGGALLARRNLSAGRGDRRGAFRLSAFVFCVLLAMWIGRAHFVVSMGTLGMFLLAVTTAIAHAVLVWTVYLALEPYIRRHWPHAIIGWTRVLSGQINDPGVGRDALIGIAVGVTWNLISRVADIWDPSLGFMSTDALSGTRNMLGSVLMDLSRAISGALFFFFLLFLLRALLRKQWLAGVAFILLWVLLKAPTEESPWLSATAYIVIYSIVVLVVLRFGLLALAVAQFAAGLTSVVPTLHASAWFFPNLMLVLAGAVAFAAWAFHAATGGRLFKQDWFN